MWNKIKNLFKIKALSGAWENDEQLRVNNKIIDGLYCNMCGAKMKSFSDLDSHLVNCLRNNVE